MLSVEASPTKCQCLSDEMLLQLQEGGAKLEVSIEQLLNAEKQMRLAGDVAGTKKAVMDILELCFEAKAWKTLNDQIVLLSKRRGQLKQVNFKTSCMFTLLFLLV